MSMLRRKTKNILKKINPRYFDQIRYRLLKYEPVDIVRSSFMKENVSNVEDFNLISGLRLIKRRKRISINISVNGVLTRRKHSIYITDLGHSILLNQFMRKQGYNIKKKRCYKNNEVFSSFMITNRSIAIFVFYFDSSQFNYLYRYFIEELIVTSSKNIFYNDHY